MECHQIIVLEEPPLADFPLMLENELPIDDYLMQLDSQFPRFDRGMCELLRQIHQIGRRILQIEPYLEMLLEIHELFSAGKAKEDIMRLPGLKGVYRAERNATGALVAYYASSVRDPFAQVVEAVKNFAKADAMRLTLREQLRSQAIASLVADQQSLFVEAGYIHYPLYLYLHRLLAPGKKVCVTYLLGEAIKAMGGKRRNLGPGDILTLHYALRHDIGKATADLLAARSLVYIKLIEKQELVPGDSRFPHAENEIKINRIVDRLSFSDCEKIFDRIRFVDRKEALKLINEQLQILLSMV